MRLGLECVLQLIGQGREEVDARHLLEVVYRYQVFVQRTLACFVFKIEKSSLSGNIEKLKINIVDSN